MARPDDLPDHPLPDNAAPADEAVEASRRSGKVPVQLHRVLEARAESFERVTALLRALPPREARHHLVVRAADHLRRFRELEARMTLPAARTLREAASDLLEDAEHLLATVGQPKR